MDPLPKVSIVVLGWNGRSYVEGCLTSVLDQDFDQPYEVLFVDNGSTDGTADAADQYAGVTVHRLGKNYGFCLGNNKGFELVKGDLVIFLNQDVVVHRDWLREMVQAMAIAPEIKAGHANLIHPWNPEFAAQRREGSLGVAHTPELSRLGFIEYKTVSDREPVIDTLFLSGASTILKRDVLDEIGGYVFDPGMFLYGEDMDLGLRIRSAGYRTVVVTGAAVYHFHTLQEQLSLRTFIKITRIIRNRLLALWKSSTWLEFVPLAAITLIGAPFNSSQFGLPLSKRIAYFFLLIPPTLMAAIALVIAMPRFAERRREILKRRRRQGPWLLRTLLFDRGSLAKTPPAQSRAV